MKPIAIVDLVADLKITLATSISEVIDKLKAALPINKSKANTLLLIEGRFNDTNLKKLRGTVGSTELDIAFNSIRADLLILINSLENADFTVQKDIESSKNGTLLYKVPSKMQLGKEVKCIIRLAFDEKYIVRNIDLDENVRIKSIKVSKIMHVGLLDPNSSQNFSIRSFSDSEQFIDTDDYTEWLFYIRPLHKGSLPLLLKISIVEIIEGKERLRNLIFEETVDVIVENHTDLESEFVPVFSFSKTHNPAATVASAAEKMPNTTSKGFSPKKLMSVAIIFLFISSLTFAIPLVIQEMNWSNALKDDTKETYQKYLSDYPNGRHVEEATNKIENLKPDIEENKEDASFEEEIKIENIVTETKETDKPDVEVNITPLQENIIEDKEAEDIIEDKEVEKKPIQVNPTVEKSSEDKSSPPIIEDKDITLEKDDASNIPEKNLGLGWFTDNRDGQKYTVIKYGNQYWMTENLRYKTPQSWKTKAENRLYTFAAAQIACPKGWHLPSDAEWKELALSAGGYSEKGFDKNRPEKAFHTFQQQISENKNDYFNGLRTPEGEIKNQGGLAVYWTSTTSSKGAAYNYFLSKETKKLHRDNNSNRTSGFSCRCILD